MPALHPFNTFDLVGRTVANTTNQLEHQIQNVSCSWPISGEYGVGTRVLYYVLVAACVLARKSEWLRNACLAAALIFPATAAIHAIVIASLHVDGAVDLDIYGAFQLCTIGILTAPATVRLSKTYFNNPGRNLLFVWTMLVLAGLLALAVEFFRAHSVPCSDNGDGRPLYRGATFPYGNATCGLACAVGNGPYSPMRDGAADNIYVIPTPHVLSFGAATLVAAACCIPGVLSMVTTYQKILKTNWAKQSRGPDVDEVIEGTNGATIKGMKTVNDVIRQLLSLVEIPVFGAAVLALIILGERNFWSDPVKFQNEPIANVSQWSNIGASVLAACGSLYMLLAKHLQSAQEGEEAPHCTCQCHEHGSSRTDSLSDCSDMEEIPRPPPSTTTVDSDVRISRRDTSPSRMLSPIRTDTHPGSEDAARGLGIHTIDSHSSTSGNKHEVTKTLMKIATAFGTASPDRFSDHTFRQGKVTGFPEVPGEGNRNSELSRIRQRWGEPIADIIADNDDALTPRGRRSRANSFNGSIHRSGSVSRAPSPHPRPRAQTTGPGTSGSLLGLPPSHSPESTSETVFPTPARPSTELEPTRSATIVTLHEGPNSPAIVLSLEDDFVEEPAEAAFPLPRAEPPVPRVEPPPPRAEPPAPRAEPPAPHTQRPAPHTERPPP